MKKRAIAVFLALVLLLSVFTVGIYAEDADTDDTRASAYLNMYGASLIQGNSGQLKIIYTVYATHHMDTVGVFSITVRNNDGSIHQIIWGSTANGLQTSNDWSHAGVYTLNLVSGNTYYCNVKVIAQDATGGDTRTVTTARVTCP